MKNLKCVLTTILVLSLAPLTHSQSAHRTNAQIVEFIFDIQQHRLLEMAEVMPAEKYSFVPAGEGFHGVRTFAEQLRHIAVDNYLLGAAMLGEKPPVDIGKGEDGPESIRTKPDVIDYVTGSFAYMRRAVHAIDNDNAPIPTTQLSPWPKGTATRLGLALEDCVHTWDHYGQLAEYFRMNGTIPPESRK